MMYTVKEIYATLQGEGAQTGRAAVFLRFAGCNLWSGLERDRESAVCQFCDTDFIGMNGPGGGKFADAGVLAAAVERVWRTRGGDDRSPQPSSMGRGSCTGRAAAFLLPMGDGQGQGLRPLSHRYVVCTGGEPLLQLDAPLLDALHAKGFEIAIETNGTLHAPPGVDWICVSPKSTAPLLQTSGDELKLVFPQSDATPGRFEMLGFTHFFLQPMDGPARDANIQAAAHYCLVHPTWRLSLQTHKTIGLP